MFDLYPKNIKTKKPIGHFFVESHFHMTPQTAYGWPKLEYFAQEKNVDFKLLQPRQCILRKKSANNYFYNT